MGQGDSPTVRAESWLSSLLQGPGRSGKAVRCSMSQTVRAWLRKIRGRQVAAVGAEAENEELAIALRAESGDFLVIGDRRNRIVPSRNNDA